jgi:hypothetical protein
MPTLLRTSKYLLEVPQGKSGLTRRSACEGSDPILNVGGPNLMDSPAA